MSRFAQGPVLVLRWLAVVLGVLVWVLVVPVVEIVRAVAGPVYRALRPSARPSEAEHARDAEVTQILSIGEERSAEDTRRSAG